MRKILEEWAQQLLSVSIPCWDELPNFELYSEQLVQIIRDTLWFLDKDDEPVITAAMINNYVKHKMMPKPIKKKYDKTHLAYLIAISLLKQVLTIPQINAGIKYQSQISGLKGAYNLFCEEMNQSLHNIVHLINEEEIKTNISKEKQAMNFATNAFSYKLIAEKFVSIHEDLDEKENN